MKEELGVHGSRDANAWLENKIESGEIIEIF